MANVSTILANKGNQVWSIPPHAPVYAALELMAAKGIGALLVIEDEEIKGILSERDYARKVVLLGKTSKSTPVAEIMTHDVLVVSPEHSLDDCLGIMTGKKIRHLPVLEGDKILGMISIGDVVNYVLLEKQHVIEHLESYIKGH